MVSKEIGPGNALLLLSFRSINSFALLVWRSTGVYACLHQFMDFALNALALCFVSVYTQASTLKYTMTLPTCSCVGPSHTNTQTHINIDDASSKCIQPKTSVNSCCIYSEFTIYIEYRFHVPTFKIKMQSRCFHTKNTYTHAQPSTQSSHCIERHFDRIVRRKKETMH